MRISACTALTLLALASFHTPAAYTAAPLQSWLKPAAEIPVGSLTPLTVSLNPDRTLCEKTYGRRWAERCVRPFGMNAGRVSGVRLTPAMKGTWRWQGPDMLAFYPAEPWPDAVNYTVSLENLPVPAGVTLSAKTVAVSTPPLSMTSGTARFWLDPSVQGERSLTFEAYFSTAVKNTDALEKAFRLETDPEGPELGKPQFIWNFERTSLYVRVPVLKIGAKAAVVRALMPGVAGAWETADGSHASVTPGFETAALTVRVPAASGLYEVTAAKLTPARTATLERTWELTLRTTVLTKPDDLLKVLRVTELPAKLNVDSVSNTDWTAAPKVDDEVLTRGRSLAVTPLQDPAVASDTIRFAVKARPGTFLHVSLPAGFGPERELTLDRPWQSVLRVNDPGASVGFLEPGSMLTLSGKRTLTVTADGVDRVRWRIERVRDPFLAMVAQQYRAHELATAAEAVSDAAEGTMPFVDDQRFAALTLDSAQLPGGRAGLFQVTLIGEKQTEHGWETQTETRKRLLVTDTALIVKSERSGEVAVFAANLSTGRPAAGVSVTLLGANGVPLETVTADADGVARLSSTVGLEREKRPTAVVARDPASGDLAWISITDPANIDRLSDFDVAGRAASANALTGYVFTDRGLYRPGETLHAGILLKNADWSVLPEGLPVTLRITDEIGRVISLDNLTLTAEGLAEYHMTLPKVLTGRLTLDLTAGDTVLSSATVRAEDFAPETMTLTSGPAAQHPGWLTPDEADVKLHLLNDFGTAAADRDIRATLSVRPAGALYFAGWEGWTFEDPTPYEGRTSPMTLPTVTTDAQGNARLQLPAALFGGRTVRASLALEGLDASGSRAATDSLSLLISSAPRMLGRRLPDTADDLNWLPAGKPVRIELALLDRTLGRAAGETLSVTLAHRQYVTELTSDSRGMLRYRDRAVETPISETVLTTDADGRADLHLDTAAPGEMTAVIRAADGMVLTRIPYRVAGEDLRVGLSGALPAAQMRMTAEKSAYEAGDTAVADILSPFSGFALLTLEADRVLENRWVPVKAGHTTVTLPVTTTASGKAWLSASLVRDKSEAARFLKPYARAVVPVMLNAKPHALSLRLDAPSLTTDPGRINVKLTSETRGKAFVWAVDEGILSLTDFRTPNPTHALLEDRALQVQTRQTLDGLMPEGIRLPGQLPYGGDAVLAKALSATQVNPFRRTGEAAVVWWGGLVDVGPDGTPLTVTLPETFSGRVRLMAAGASDLRLGSADKAVTVRQSLILSPQLPIFAAPSDRLTGGVTLTSEKPFVGTLSAVMPDGAAGGFAERVTLTAPGDVTRTFEMTLPNTPGAMTLRFAAASENARIERTRQISVRPAGLRSTETHWAGFKAGTRAFLTPGNAVLPLESETVLRVSALPAPAVRALMDELPAGSWDDPSVRIAEALPWAVLKASPQLLDALGYERDAFEKEAAQRIDRALRSIADHLGWSGVQSWNDASELTATAMALDFMLTLRESGTTVPSETLREVTQSLGRLLDGAPPATLAQGRTAAWALALLTREGTLAAERIEALRRSMDRARFGWKTDAAAGFIASAYRDMRMTAEADKLLAADIRATGGTDDTPSELGGLTALAALSALTDKAGDGRTAALLLKALEKRAPSSLSIRERAYAANALIRSGLTTAGTLTLEGVTLTCTKRDAGADASADRLTRTTAGLTLSAPGCRSFAVSAPTSLEGLWWQTSQTGWPAGDMNVAVANGLEITKRLLDDEGRPVETLTPGTAVTVEIRARRTAGSDGSPVIVTDLLPGGFELTGERNSVTGDGILKTLAGNDRIQFAVFLSSYERIYTYRIRPLTPGVFTLPPAEAGDASAPHIRARGTQGRVTVRR